MEQVLKSFATLDLESKLSKLRLEQIKEISRFILMGPLDPSLSTEDLARADGIGIGHQEIGVEELGFTNQDYSRYFSTCVSGVHNVWNYNLDFEIGLLSSHLEKFPIVAMDTEFPEAPFELVYTHAERLSLSTTEKTYQEIRGNVNLLKLIQLGICLLDKDGKTPEGICGWQFNFLFDLRTDCSRRDSMRLLRKAGLEFGKHATIGIKPEDFAKKFLEIGILASNKFSWVVFHGGYDFAYLLKVLTGGNLPDSSETFIEAMIWMFPNIFDVKYLCNFCRDLSGGLQLVAQMMNIKPIGIPHQAGSDAHVTGSVFHGLMKYRFPEGLEQYCGQLSGFDHQLVAYTRQSIEACRTSPDKIGIRLATYLFQKNVANDKKDQVKELFLSTHEETGKEEQDHLAHNLSMLSV